MRNDRKILIAGASGQLAGAFADYFKEHNICCIAPSEENFDITDAVSIDAVMLEHQPDVVLNCAAYNNVDLAQDQPDVAYKVNTKAVEYLATACQKHNAFFVHYSTDYVFDGKQDALYREDDQPHPLNVYGSSKLAGEQAVQAVGSDFLILRLSWVFGRGKMNFLYKLNQWAEGKDTLNITSDEISVPTFTDDVVAVTCAALKQGVTGLYHLTNSGYCSRYDWARYYFDKKGRAITLNPVALSSFKTNAARPSNSGMSNAAVSRKLNITIPTWQNAVDRYIEV